MTYIKKETLPALNTNNDTTTVTSLSDILPPKNIADLIQAVKEATTIYEAISVLNDFTGIIQLITKSFIKNGEDNPT